MSIEHVRLADRTDPIEVEIYSKPQFFTHGSFANNRWLNSIHKDPITRGEGRGEWGGLQTRMSSSVQPLEPKVSCFSFLPPGISPGMSLLSQFLFKSWLALLSPIYPEGLNYFLNTHVSCFSSRKIEETKSLSMLLVSSFLFSRSSLWDWKQDCAKNLEFPASLAACNFSTADM